MTNLVKTAKLNNLVFATCGLYFIVHTGARNQFLSKKSKIEIKLTGSS